MSEGRDVVPNPVGGWDVKKPHAQRASLFMRPRRRQSTADAKSCATMVVESCASIAEMVRSEIRTHSTWQPPDPPRESK